MAVKSITDKQECGNLLSYLKDLIPSYRNSSHIDIPLPHVVDVTKQNMTETQCLFNTDNKEHNRNLHTLIINDIANPVYRKNLTYVKELTIIERYSYWREPIPVADTQNIAASMTSLTAINVKSDDKNGNMDFKQLFEKLPKNNIKKIKLQGSNVKSQTSTTLWKFKSLHYLEITAFPEYPEINKIFESLKACKLLNDLCLQVHGFPAVLPMLDDNVKLNLTITKCNKEDTDTFVDNLEKNQASTSSIQPVEQPVRRPNISTLNLSGNNLYAAGLSLGSLMVCLPGIQVLDLGCCRIEADILREMSDVIRRDKTRLDIKQLILGNKDIYSNNNNNNLCGCGVYLQQILDHTASLHTLDLYRCEMFDDDINKLAESNTCKNIKRLQLSTGKAERDPIRRITCIYRFQMLNVLSLSSNGSHILSRIRFNLLPHLRVLSLWGYNLSHSLYDVFNNIENLEALSVAECNMSDIHDLIMCVSSLPSLAHLDIHDNKYGSDVLEITKTKQQMSNLHRLNIGPMRDKKGKEMNRYEYEDYVAAIREELHQENADLLVYCDRGEDMWEMYK